jgi:TetR/AcrR family transcriptional regulator, fatty acid biosynthesis regulator
MKINKSFAKKKRTRSNLIESALALMGEVHGIEFLSIREVAKGAGIVPAGFYRHFPSIEDLGLAIVDEVGKKLRTILQEARKKKYYLTQSRGSMELFFRYVNNNRILFRFILREKDGGSRKIRDAIRNEMHLIAEDIVPDLKIKNTNSEELKFLADFIVATVFHLAGEFLDCNEADLKLKERILRVAFLKMHIIQKGFSRLNRKRLG